MRFSNGYEIVEALLLDRLNETFDVRIHVRIPIWRLNNFDAPRF